MPTLGKILDRAICNPAFMRKLKDKSGHFKIKTEGRAVTVSYEKSDAGHFTFATDLPENTKLR